MSCSLNQLATVWNCQTLIQSPVLDTKLDVM